MIAKSYLKGSCKVESFDGFNFYQKNVRLLFFNDEHFQRTDDFLSSFNNCFLSSLLMHFSVSKNQDLLVTEAKCQTKDSLFHVI